MSLEQVLEWNPGDLRRDRYPQVVKQIENDPQWQAIDAVKHHRVWLMPEYAKARGYPMPEATALGELWMAKNSILRATRASMWTVKPGIIISVLPRGVDARCPLTLSRLVQGSGAGDAGDRGRLALFRPVPVKPERRWPHRSICRR